MIRRRFAAILALFLIGSVTQTGAVAQDRPVTVFAASSMQNVLTDVGKAYEARTGRKVQFSFAASSALARQIESGAPADVFVSADTDWMDYVAQRGLIAGSSRVNIAANRLALIAPAGSSVRLAIGRNMPIGAALGRGGRLALAAPEVPAGKYAEEALTAFGVWSQVEDRTARAENVRAAMQFVARGEAPLGVVYDTDARLEPRVRIVGLFPASSHTPIVYPAALVGRPPHRDAADFLKFIRGPEAGRVFSRYGFTRPGR